MVKLQQYTFVCAPQPVQWAGHRYLGPAQLDLRPDLRPEGYGLEPGCLLDVRAVLGVFCRRWGVPLIDGGTVRLLASSAIDHSGSITADAGANETRPALVERGRYLVTIGGPYLWEIVLPGSLVGIIVGFATQRYGGARAPETASR